MASKKPSMYLRIRKDRMDLLKEMNGELNKRSVEAGGKEKSFNRFMEEIVERFLVSDYGQRLCGIIDDKRKVESDNWKLRRKENAPSEDSYK